MHIFVSEVVEIYSCGGRIFEKVTRGGEGMGIL